MQDGVYSAIAVILSGCGQDFEISMVGAPDVGYVRHMCWFL